MSPKSSGAKATPGERVVQDIKRATRRQFSAEEKIRIILDGLRGEDSIAELCRREGIAQSLYYVWSKEFLEAGKRRMAGHTARAATTDEVKDLRFTDERSYFVSEATVYRLLKAHDLITSPAFIVIKAASEFTDKTTRPNEMWQTDFTYLKIIGWGWMYLSTILDDFSRYIIAWKLFTMMKASDVTDTLQLALAASGCDQAHVRHKPRLLSDNGSSYISGDLATWLDDRKMTHVRGAPYHPQTQGKIERWHQTLKNRILLENYFLPGDLEGQIDAFVEHYNHRRYHEGIDNVTPADAYFGRRSAILAERARIKRDTVRDRRWLHRKLAA